MYSLSLAVAIVVASFFIIWYRQLKPTGFPKGYNGIPVLGVLPFLGNKPVLKFFEWNKIIGPVYYVQLGMKKFVILNNFESIYECFVRQGHATSGREQFDMFTYEERPEGVLLQSYTKEYKALSKAITPLLKGLGIGMQAMDTIVHKELKSLLKKITCYDETPFNPQNMLNIAASSIVMKVIFGDILQEEDPRIMKLLEMMDKISSNPDDSPLTNMISMFPWLKYFPKFSGAYQRLRGFLSVQNDIFKNLLQDTISNFDKENPKGIADILLLKQKEDEENPAFTTSQIIQTFGDLFGAGTGTTSQTLLWCLLYLSKYRDVQEKLSREIIQVIGKDILPTWKHSSHLHLVCSFIDEIARHRSVVPLATHMATKNFKLFEYEIPKGTMISSSYWSVHHDGSIFPNPDEFLPERFVDPKTGKYERSKYLISFGIGPRMCSGFQLAEKEIFIMLCGILQKFELCEDQSYPLPNFDDGVFGFSHFPREYKVTFKHR